MRKIWLVVLSVFSIMSLCSCQKDSFTEIQLEDGNIYQIHKTEDKALIKETFAQLKNAKVERTNFNGISINMDSSIAGKVSIGDTDITTVDVNYTWNIDGKMNLKKYLLEGSFELTGKTKTRSTSLSADLQQKIYGKLNNDDSYLFLNGGYETNGNKVSLKKKVSIENFTKENKGIIISICDILKYKKLTDIFPKIEEIVDSNVVAITKAQKNSFTLKLIYPLEEKNLEFYVELATATLFPIEISLNLDDILIKQLEKEYIEKYLTEQVKVDKASFKIKLKLQYGNYTISELSEQEKQDYTFFVE